MSVLSKILETKRIEVGASMALQSEAQMQKLAEESSPTRGFRQALVKRQSLALIAEVKKQSPSRGLIRADFDPVEVARCYERAGADCLSILTDREFFGGAPEYLTVCREATGLPCLRKDFLFNPYQVYQSRVLGADAILLIVAMLAREALRELYALAKSLNMDVLVEVHDRRELGEAIELGCDMIGVNNRNLSDFKTDLAVSEALLPLIPEGVVAISESALESTADLNRVQKSGAKAVLIGTTFCSSLDIEAKVVEVMGWSK